LTIYGTSETSLGILIAKWHRQHHAGSAFVPPYGAIGWHSGRDLYASAIFCNYTGCNIDIHLAIGSKPSIRIWRDILRYVFEYLQCQRLTGIVPASHMKLLRLVRGLNGWRCEGSLSCYFPGNESGLIYGLLAKDAKKVLDGQQSERTEYPECTRHVGTRATV
jgi:hypothetical protein